MDPIQVMPSFDALATKDYKPRQWLQYYRNIWVRNAVARAVDVQNDTTMKTVDPEQMVNGDEGRPIKVKERLEYRKISVQDALDTIKAIDVLMAIEEDKFAEACWSKEALAVAPDMIPPAPEKKAGYSCLMPDGKTAGKLESDGKGNLVCVATPLSTEKDKDGKPSEEAAA